MSHPTWVRGLKLFKQRICVIQVESHPTWVRGLKRHQLLYIHIHL